MSLQMPVCQALFLGSEGGGEGMEHMCAHPLPSVGSSTAGTF